MNQKYLTTVQAATRCSVTPDTVLKWIQAGRLPARRTAGGHHRIDEKDLEKLLEDTPPSGRGSRSSVQRRPFRYCWEYNGNGKLLDGCSECAVYQMRAQRCYEVAKLAPEAGPPKTFCFESCTDCDFYRLVQGQRVNVLVVTDNKELTRRLRDSEAAANFNLEIADCEYTCSAVVNDFRPDFAIIDCSLGTRTSRDIANHLMEDPRIPLVRVVLAANEGEYPDACEETVFARLNRGFGIADINACIEGIKPGNWEESKHP